MDYEKIMMNLSNESLERIVEAATTMLAERKEKARERVCMEFNSDAQMLVKKINEYSPYYTFVLNIIRRSGRQYHIPLSDDCVASWGIEVNFKNKQNDNEENQV